MGCRTSKEAEDPKKHSKSNFDSIPTSDPGTPSNAAKLPARYQAAAEIIPTHKNSTILPCIFRDAVFGLAYHPTEPDMLFGGGVEKVVHKFSWVTGKVVDTVADNPHTKDITKVHYCPAHNYLVTSSRDQNVKTYCLNSKSCTNTFTGHKAVVNAFGVNDAESRVLSGSRDNTLRLWDIETGKMVAINNTPRNIVQSMRWIPNTDTVLQGGEDLHLRHWDCRASSLHLIDDIADLVYHPICMDVSCDGLYVTTGHNGFSGEGSMVRVWDMRMHKLLHELTGHTFTVSNVCYLPGFDGYVATTSHDNTVRLWDVNAGAQLGVATVPGGRICSLAPCVQSTDLMEFFVGFDTGVITKIQASKDHTLSMVLELGTHAEDDVGD